MTTILKKLVSCSSFGRLLREERTTLIIIKLLAMGIVAGTIWGCTDSNKTPDPGRELEFSRYDIEHSVAAPPSDKIGQIKLNTDREWIGGEIIYSERDSRFLVRDRHDGSWNTTWAYAFAYGTFSHKGIRPHQSATYICRETGQKYTVGSDGELKPVESVQGGSKKEIRVVSWNVGCFTKGTDAKLKFTDINAYEALCKEFAELTWQMGADLAGICEYRPTIFDGRNISSDIFGCYPFACETTDADNYHGNALFSTSAIRNVRSLNLGIGTALEGDILIGGTTVKVCICHATWWKNRIDGDANWRELKALAERYRHIRNVILMGDFNVMRDRQDRSWNLFADAGFIAANRATGDSPLLPTTYSNVLVSDAADNILVKGGRIANFEIIQSTPEGCDPLAPNPADKAKWDSVNLSDHFPLVCTIVFP